MKKKLKIAFLLPSLRNLGPIIVAHDIIRLLNQRDDIELKVFYFDFFEQNILKFNVECEKIYFFKKYDFSYFDIIHSHGLRPDLYTYFNKSCKNKISTQHNIIFDEYITSNSYLKSKIIEKIWIFSLGNKDKIISIGETAKTYYQNFHFSEGTVVNIPNGRSLFHGVGISSSDLDLISSFRKNYICIGTCTRVIKLKGHKQIIQALVDLKNFCFILVGDGNYLKELKNLACELNVSERCLFLGYRKNATDYLKLFDIFTQTSYAESISIALLEAAAARKAIVCSDIPVNRDIFSEEEVAFFSPNNISSLISAIQMVSSDIPKYESNVFEKYKNEFTSEIMAKNYYNLYKSLMYEI